MLRLAVIDDEPLARRGLRRMLGRHPNVEVVGEAGTVAAAAELVQRERPDAVLLDIELPDARGFDLLRQVAAPPRIVVVSAHAEHAVRAFDLEAVDYLLKPVSAARLADAIERLERACAAPATESDAPGTEPVIRLKTATRMLVTPHRRVIAVVAEGDFSRIMLDHAPTLLVPQPLKHFERDLPSPPFLRLSRSLIVNSRRLQQIEYGGGRAQISLLGSPSPLSLGRAATARLRAWEISSR